MKVRVRGPCVCDCTLSVPSQRCWETFATVKNQLKASHKVPFWFLPFQIFQGFSKLFSSNRNYSSLCKMCSCLIPFIWAFDPRSGFIPWKTVWKAENSFWLKKNLQTKANNINTLQLSITVNSGYILTPSTCQHRSTKESFSQNNQLISFSLGVQSWGRTIPSTNN